MSYQGKTRAELDIWNEEINYKVKKQIAIFNHALPNFKKASSEQKLNLLKEYLAAELKSVDRNKILDKDKEDRLKELDIKRSILRDILEFISDL